MGKNIQVKNIFYINKVIKQDISRRDGIINLILYVITTILGLYMNFAHLRVHTDYSKNDSLVRVSDLTSDSLAENHRAIAITDNANIYAAVKFYEKSRSSNIKPILGCEIHVTTPYGEDTLPVLCKNEDGGKDLMKIISEGYKKRENANLEPAVDLEYLLSMSKNLIVLSGGNNSLLFELLNNNQENANDYANLFKSRLGSDYFIELQRVGMTGEATYIEQAVALASEQQIPVVATNSVRFMEKGDYETHEIRSAIPLKQTLRSLRQNEAIYTPEQYLKSPEEMIELFKDIPSAISNTVSIAKKCNFEMKLGEIHLPAFPMDEGYDSDTFLIKLSEEGLEERLKFLFPDEKVRNERRGEYDERLKVELEIINNMKFPGYFLIVMEFIQWSKDNDIPVGPGRGSGAGSLVAYALKITDLDPLEYDLLFERFLNPERVSMPDFDIDFCKQGRDKVIAHVAEFYGKDAVSQIITYGTMAARSVVKDVTRVLGLPYSLGNRISMLIPDKPGTKLSDAIKSVPALEMLVQEDPQINEIMKHALKLEGLVRQTGKHAGGVLISPTTITDFSPIYSESSSSSFVSQFDKDDVEKRGLVKFDFLGLQTLTVIKRAIDLANIKQVKENKSKLDSSTIPLNDPETYKLLQEGNTTGVFQLESAGMKNLVKRLNPETFEEIIALVALYRPGPLDAGMVDTFINCKKGIEEIHYPHPSLECILDVTNGVFVYQEQVMQAAQIMAKYSLGEADLLRRAMGKKKPEEMAKQRVMFTEGSVSNGIDENDAKHVFDLMETFAGYGFNKSHSASYAVLSVVTAYLKAHHPAPFYAANLTLEADSTDKVVKLIHDANENGVKVLPPCINTSLAEFNVNENDEVTYGLASIDGVGETIRNKIIEERDRSGNFLDMFDFMVRVNPNIKVIKSCIYAGAFDTFNETREEMHSYVDHVAKINSSFKDKIKKYRAKDDSERDLLSESESDILASHREQFLSARKEHGKDNLITKIELIKEERKRLGLYMTSHPTLAYGDEIKSEMPTSISTIADRSGEDVLNNEKEQNGQNVVTITGAIVDIDIKNNKKGQTATLKIDDGTAQMTVRLGAKLLNDYFHVIELDEVISIKTHMSYNPNSERFWFKALSIKDIDMIRQQNVDFITINVDLNNPVKKDQIKMLLSETKKGTTRIKVKNTGSIENEVFEIGEGRVADDTFRAKVANIIDTDEPLTVAYKSKDRSIDREFLAKNRFKDKDSDYVKDCISKANKALREAKEVMGQSISG
jgi:DNA polymerase-3 subunit alpha